ncbi:MAG: 5,6-dimethylbenzimidazole synthase [Rhodocyclaceae bacterium]|nr:5,6-dimethylbenzimidazole synthase [Rhodocyclaceae bacterium]
MSRFEPDQIEALYAVMRARRDMRHFRPDPLDPALLARLLDAALLAPSVGHMQPWRFIRIADRSLRRRIHTLVAAEIERTAEACGERAGEVRRLKLEGILDCGEVLVAALPEGREPYVLGRRTLPEMDVCSLACAIQNLWLAARAEGIGMGWVSLFDPEALARLLDMPPGARPLAILCLGAVDDFYPAPLLETLGWDARRPRESVLFENRWGDPL